MLIIYFGGLEEFMSDELMYCTNVVTRHLIFSSRAIGVKKAGEEKRTPDAVEKNSPFDPH